MPAAKQRSRSPSMAFAVSAMMGTRALPEASSRRRISAVAVNPSMTGIWQSISTAS